MPSRQELVVRGNAVGLTASNYPNDSKFEQKILYLEKRATTFAGTLGTGTLTSTGSASSDGDQVTIGSVTYTFKTALTELKATQTLTSDATAPSDGDTVNINGYQYTFRTALSSPAQAFEVLIGGSAAAALDNLKIAVNASGGTEGTEYSVGTYAHPLVTATTNANTTQVIQARQFGTTPNSYSVGENSTHLSWGAATLTGGVANIANEVLIDADPATMLDNLKLAINYTLPATNEGLKFSSGTRAHPEVTATTNTDTTQVVQAVDYSYTNASIGTTDPVDANSRLSWGATTLASGVAAQTALNTSTASGSAGLSGDKNI